MQAIASLEEYRAKSEQRAREESERRPKSKDEDGSSAGSGPPLDFITQCLYAEEIGDSLLYNYLNKNKFVYNTTQGRWFRYLGPNWEYDCDGRAQAVIESTVVAAYLELLGDVKKQLAEVDDKETVKGLMKRRNDITKRVAKLRTIKGITALMKCSPINDNPLIVRDESFDKHLWLLPVKNGVLDLRSGDLREGKPEDFFLKACPVEWAGLDAPCPVWEASLSASLNDQDDLVAFMHRLLGYACTGLSIEHRFFVLRGKRGRNGKDTMMETLYSLLGPFASSINVETLLYQRNQRSPSGPSPEVVAFKGLRIACASEPSENSFFDIGKIKLYTGGGRLKGRGVNAKEYTEFVPTHTLFLLTNPKPHASADDDAFWERVVMINFPISFVDNPEGPFQRQRDPDLKEKLQAELPGILAWLVRGVMEYRKHGLAIPQSVIDATKEYRRAEDNIQDFIDECCLVDHDDPDCKVDFKSLYGRFKSWWAESFPASRAPSKKKLGTLLKDRFEEGKSNGNRIYRGVRINYAAIDLESESRG